MSDSLCTLHVSLDKLSCLPVYELQQKLEDSNTNSKIIAMENVILGTLKGGDLSSLLIPIIRYVISSSDHKLIKLVHLYFEIVEKTNPDGNIREEIILVCNALRNYLHAPNEYVRGSTLRLLCKIKHWKIMSPLVSSMIQNLTHKEAYVRRHAVMCVAAISRQFGGDAIPDLIDHVKKILLNESDTSTKCKAFQLLLRINPPLALQYILSIEDSLITSGDVFQIGIVKSLNKFAIADQACRVCAINTLGIRIVLLLMETVQTINVIYQGAMSLLTVGTTTLEARKVTAKTFVNILISQPDVNIKLITLSNLQKLYNISKKAGDHPNVLEAHVIDIAGVLNNPYHLIVKRCLSFCFKILTESNVGQVLSILKKEFIKSCINDDQSMEEYQVTIIKAIMQICELFPREAEIVFDMFECLNMGSKSTKYHIAIFIHKLFNMIPDFKKGTIRKLLPIIPQIDDVNVLRICFSIISHAPSVNMSGELIELFYSSIQPYPLVDSLESCEETNNYPKEQSSTNLRRVILTCDSLLLSSLSSLLLKFVCTEITSEELLEKASIVVANLLMLGKRFGIERGSIARMTHALRTMIEKCQGSSTHDIENFYLEFDNLSMDSKENLDSKRVRNIKNYVSDPITFRLLSGENDTIVAEDIFQNENNGLLKRNSCNFPDKIPFQMTGLGDPIYIEVVANIINSELDLSMSITNTTNVLLQNIYIELYTQGKLKVMDHIPTFKLSPNESTTVKTRVRVSSSAMGSIFGYVYYEQKACGRPEVLNISPLSINMIDFVVPTFIDSDEFQSMWSSYEWENKICIQTNITEHSLFLEKLISSTNMTVAGRIPPDDYIVDNEQPVIQQYIEYLRGLQDFRSVLDTCSFFAANLFLRTIFNEDALVNLSLSKDKQGFLKGVIRIRCANQETVVSLGEGISLVQRCFSAPPLPDSNE